MTKYGMKVDRNFKVTIVEIDDVLGLPRARHYDGIDKSDQPRRRHYGPSEAELQADSVSDEERDLAIAEAARIQEVHDEAHRRFDEKCRDLNIPYHGRDMAKDMMKEGI